MAESGQMEKFDSKRDEWDSWSRRFDQWLSISSYATGNNAADKKRAVFCTLIGSDLTFKLLCTLCTPKRPEEETYDDLRTKAQQTVWSKETRLGRTLPFLFVQTAGQTVVGRLPLRTVTKILVRGKNRYGRTIFSRPNLVRPDHF